MAGRHERAWAEGDKRRAIKLGLLGILCVILLVGGMYAIGSWMDSRTATEQQRGVVTERDERPIITMNGAEYRLRRNLMSILFMGVDKAEDAVSTGFRNGGQSDFLMLLVMDKDAGTMTPIHIDRDTMTDITIIGILGNEAGTRNLQICLSHGFGDGKEQSCRLTVEAVSKLLLGVPVDHYIEMNLSGISTLNDALGGITVTLEDDFTSLDPAMTQGTTLTLQGMQAEYYVRSRMSIGIGTNESRMVRQRVYLNAAMEVFGSKVRESSSFVGSVYDAVQKDLLTDMKRGRLINEAWSARNYAREAIVTLPGEHTVGADGFVEFHADEAALTDLVLSIFYERLD